MSETIASNVDFDRQRFEDLMNDGARWHGRGEYDLALRDSREAFDMAPLDSVEAGRAARDTGARYDRLGEVVTAEGWVALAFDIHDAALHGSSEPLHVLHRERAATAIYVGTLAARRYLRNPPAFRNSEGSGSYFDDPLRFSREALADMGWARHFAPTICGSLVDQYDVNIARRAVVIEALFGDRKHSLLLSARAIALAPFSEVNWMPTANPNLTAKGRNRAKRKALAAGAGALGVGLLSLPPNILTDQLARGLADRVL